jgi:hypothetical protein
MNTNHTTHKTLHCNTPLQLKTETNVITFKCKTKKRNTQINKSSKPLYKARLHAHEGRGVKSTNLKTHQHTNMHCDQQMANRGKAIHEAIMRSPTDTNMEDLEDTMLIETTQAKRT